jgi:hypothetical protein
MPPGEVFFFDVDDVEQHADFFVPTANGWTFHDYDADHELYLDWYRSLFRPARADQMVGEDSTTYLASRLAPARIAELLPGAKLIALLRDPVARAYSHYWHNVSRGRATEPFARTLHRAPGSYLSRGFYAEQLARYRPLFGPDQLRVVFFEDFVADQQRTVDALCEFLGLPETIDVSRVTTHRNAARAPLHLPTRLLVNRLSRPLRRTRYNRRIPNMPGFRPTSGGVRIGRSPLVDRVAELYESVLPGRRPPPMAEETRRFLQQLFRRRNSGLSELVGRDVSEVWPYMR